MNHEPLAAPPAPAAPQAPGQHQAQANQQVVWQRPAELAQAETCRDIWNTAWFRPITPQQLQYLIDSLRTKPREIFHTVLGEAGIEYDPNGNQDWLPTISPAERYNRAMAAALTIAESCEDLHDLSLLQFDVPDVAQNARTRSWKERVKTPVRSKRDVSAALVMYGINMGEVKERKLEAAVWSKSSGLVWDPIGVLHTDEIQAWNSLSSMANTLLTAPPSVKEGAIRLMREIKSCWDLCHEGKTTARLMETLAQVLRQERTPLATLDYEALLKNFQSAWESQKVLSRLDEKVDDVLKRLEKLENARGPYSSPSSGNSWWSNDWGANSTTRHKGQGKGQKQQSGLCINNYWKNCQLGDSCRYSHRSISRTEMLEYCRSCNSAAAKIALAKLEQEIEKEKTGAAGENKPQ